MNAKPEPRYFRWSKLGTVKGGVTAVPVTFALKRHAVGKPVRCHTLVVRSKRSAA